MTSVVYKLTAGILGLISDLCVPTETQKAMCLPLHILTCALHLAMLVKHANILKI